MRRRLLVVSMTLVGVVLLALMAPLLNAHAEDRTQDLFVGRLGDVTRSRCSPRTRSRAAGSTG